MQVGHSLGGALAELDSLYMTMNLPSSVHVKGVTYGTPRVGNPAYATYFDSIVRAPPPYPLFPLVFPRAPLTLLRTQVPDFERINHASDPIPIVPGRFLGFSHVHGEVHIVSGAPDVAYACPGDDDASDAQCTISSVPNVFESNIIDHLGPYDGIYIGTVFCT